VISRYNYQPGLASEFVEGAPEAGEECAACIEITRRTSVRQIARKCD
jgi:hypothetical protein